MGVEQQADSRQEHQRIAEVVEAGPLVAAALETVASQLMSAFPNYTGGQIQAMMEQSIQRYTSRIAVWVEEKKAERLNQPPSRPMPPRPAEVFGFTKQEETFYRVKDDRFRALLQDEQTSVHDIQVSTNNYGGFLFVTVSRKTDQGPVAVTFYGLGFHEHRERWITDQWYWYRNNPVSEALRNQVSKQEAEEVLHHRLEMITPYVTDWQPSERAKLFTMIADLTDEDAAYAELGDLEDLGLLDDYD